MSSPLALHPDRCLPADPDTRAVARRLLAEVASLPILSPHGHTDPRWFAENEAFEDPTSALLIPDHYIFRMLYSQGVALEDLGIPRADGGPVETDRRRSWRLFAERYHLFRGTPTRIWLDHVFAEVFGLTERLEAATADAYYDRIDSCLADPAFRPRALYERFGIEVLATTESPLDPLTHHRHIAASGWKGRVITAFRPDPVVDPEHDGFAANVAELGRIANQDTTSYRGYLAALINRRRYFAAVGGATSTDHGHPSAATFDLPEHLAETLFHQALKGTLGATEAERFRGHMLVEMARMSLEDGLVMQLHPGSWRNHNPWLHRRFGRDKGADIPQRTSYVDALKPLLDRFGNETRLTLILFTLDESAYGRELAPLAGHYPALRLGPPWWFFDSPEGMRRFRRETTETAGFYNTVGFNDDTRAFFSIPARHDLARRIDCGTLAELVVEHRLDEDEALEQARDLAYGLAKRSYKL